MTRNTGKFHTTHNVHKWGKKGDGGEYLRLKLRHENAGYETPVAACIYSRHHYGLCNGTEPPLPSSVMKGVPTSTYAQSSTVNLYCLEHTEITDKERQYFIFNTHTF